ncbi:MAG: magnesium transporter CorA family protein [Parvularculaceae bacterium]
MISAYATDNGKLRPLSDPLGACLSALWVDVKAPTPEEEAALEKAFGLDIPTREEMEEIEVSSRLYTENGAAYATALVMSKTDTDAPVVSPVTFILSDKRLITVRYEDPRAFTVFPTRAAKSPIGGDAPDLALVGLLEALIERMADLSERITRDIDRVSRDIFKAQGAGPSRRRDFHGILIDLGRKGEFASQIRDSLVTLSRAVGFLILYADQREKEGRDRKTDKDFRARLKSVARDAGSLTDHASFVADKITFLLDATLGMVNIEQNQIIKIFSIAAVAFLPPTLIASVYGMNFEHMPELASRAAYPIVIGAMILSAVIPLAYFKRRGWW